MSTPTRKEIIEAHDALNRLYQNLLHDKDTDVIALNTAIKAIVRLLPPKPKPTMAEVDWDDDKHYLAEAEQSILGKVVMLGPNEDGFINFCFLSRRESKYDAAHPSTLTPTGKRYTLKENTNA